MKPFFGYVKRSMNRAPGKNDRWWADHQGKCQGVFEKVAEPDSFKKKLLKKEETQAKKSEKLEDGSDRKLAANKLPKSSQSAGSESRSIEAYFKASQKEIKKRKSDEVNEVSTDAGDIELLEVVVKKSRPPLVVLDDDSDCAVIPLSMRETAECPVCGGDFSKDLINSHVNSHFC